jgi:sarcosine oxidase subunit gamma
VTVDAPARSPLRDRGDDLATLRARELPFLAQVSLRLEVRDALGPHRVLPPTAPNTWTEIEGRELLWLGPDEWLAVGDPGSQVEILRWLDAAFAGLHRSVVDVSANRVAIELAGPDRLELLAAGCGLDLHPRSWGDGACAQTLVGRIPVLLQERVGATRVYVRPSFGGAVLDWLLAVAGR